MKTLLLIPLALFLTGCPGGPSAPEYRGIFMQNDVICFSINNNEILEHYNIYYAPKGIYTRIKTAEGLHLSYPDTCIKVKFKNGYEYSIYYGIDGKSYTDNFFIDNDGRR
ncbi:putative T6SS immunity periplasmic lipoprotein [Pseudescherichia vulneris]